MPQVNLSSLSGLELRQMLDSSRRRGDAGLSYSILQEMAARRAKATEKRPRRAKGEPAPERVIAVDMGDPLEPDEDELPPMPKWRPPVREAAAAPEPPAPSAAPDEPPSPAEAVAPEPIAEPARQSEPEPPKAEEPIPTVTPSPAPTDPHADRPLTLSDGPLPQLESPPLGEQGLRLHPESNRRERRAPPPQRPRSSRFVLGLSLGVLIGLAGGLWGGEYARERLAPVAAAPAPAQKRAPASPPPPAPAAEPETAATSAPAAEALPETTPPAEAADAPSVPTPEAAPAEPAAAQPEPAAAPPAPTPTHAANNACAREPTPADRTICGDAHLRELQGELRDAYNAALDAHEDRALLRERQLAWRDARNGVDDPDKLARLYEDRIRKLKSATAAAKAAAK